MPYNTLELEKIRKHIENQSRDLKQRSNYSDSQKITSNFILASSEVCRCLECTSINSPIVQSSILKPVQFIDKLLPFLRELNNQNLEQAINDYDHAKCSRLKSNLAINLISKSFGVCLDRDSFSFLDENILVLNIFMATEQFIVKINEN